MNYLHIRLKDYINKSYIRFQVNMSVISKMPHEIEIPHDRNSRPVAFFKKEVLKCFTKLTGKHLRPATSLKKRFWHRCFLVNFGKFLRVPFLQKNFGRLLPTWELRRDYIITCIKFNVVYVTLNLFFY